MSSGIVFEEIECKSAINKVSAPGMMFQYSLNPYRGCQHACVYCFARGTHEYLGYDAGRDFESRIIVKTNLPQVLRQELRRPSWKRDLIVLGTACDPYQQAEMKYEITKRCLHVLRDAMQPVHMLTKSTNVLRDVELWSQLSRATDAQIAFSIPTLDEIAWKKMEPGTAQPVKRFKAMRELSDAGVRCGVMIAPVIPGVTDREDQIEQVIVAAKEHGASFVAPNVLYLKPGTKEWFMPALREAYPHLAGKYERYYKGAYAPKDYTREVTGMINRLREKYGFSARSSVRSTPPGTQMQLAI